MRKPVVIEEDLCGPMWNTVLRFSNRLDVCDKMYMTFAGIVGLKGAVKKLASAVLADAAAADAELGFGPEPAEADARAYLKSLAVG